MDHQFLNVDCHPSSSLPRQSLHPSYGGHSGGTYPLDLHQSGEGNPLVNQFNPYRLPPVASEAPAVHGSLSSSSSSSSSAQFSAFDSFYKAYQSAYGQNSSLAGVMFGHPSYRFDGSLLPHDQQLMLPTGFLQYPPLFSNSSLYASAPNPRYPSDYFGQNLPGLSPFSGTSSKFPSGPDLASAQSWLGLERSMPSNLLNAFVAPLIASESSKDPAKKTCMVDGAERYESRGSYSVRSTHQPGSATGRTKPARQGEEGNPSRHPHLSTSLQSSLLQGDPFDPLRRGNGESSGYQRRPEVEDKKQEASGQNCIKESPFQKRTIQASPHVLCKSTSFPIMSSYVDGLCSGDGSYTMAQNFARHSSDYLFNHYATKMYPSNSFSSSSSSSSSIPTSELLGLQSRTALSSTFYQHPQNPQRPRDPVGKSPRSEEGVGSKSFISSSSLSASTKQALPDPHHRVDRTSEQKFHRPFELAPVGKETSHASIPSQKSKRSSGKVAAAEDKIAAEKSSSQHKSAQQNSHHQNHHHLQQPSKSSCDRVFQSPSCTDKSERGMSSNQPNPPGVGSDCSPRPGAEETPLNLACGAGKGEVGRSRRQRLVSKLDLEEAWRSTEKHRRSLTGDSGRGGGSRDASYEDLYNAYEYEYERKIARLTTVVDCIPLDPSNHTEEKIDFLSSLGLSSVEKCKELEYEKHRRRKRQIRERSISPTLLEEEEEEGEARPGFDRCTSDCPHKNGLDKEAMLAMLGLHQVEISGGKGKYYEESDLAPSGSLQSYGDSSTTQCPQSFPYSATPFYAYPGQYPPASHVPTSVYNFVYNSPGYPINQNTSVTVPTTSSSLSSSSSSSSLPPPSLTLATSTVASRPPGTPASEVSPYCNFYNEAAIPSKTLSYPYHHHHHHHHHPHPGHGYDDQQQVYYQQGKDEGDSPPKPNPPLPATDGSFIGYGSFENQNPMETSSPNASSMMMMMMMDRCISSTPMSSRHHAGASGGGGKECTPLENGPSKGSEPALLHWPGVESIIESYHHYVEERAMEKQLLVEHSAKLCRLNADNLSTYEQLKSKISDLRNVRTGLEAERELTQSQLDGLKNFIMQLK